MKHIKTLTIICGLIVWTLAFPTYGEYLLSTGVRYDTFVDDQSPKTKGFEVTIPLGVAYRKKQFSFSVESAYSSANADPGEEDDVSLASMTDTLLSASYTYSFSNRPMGLIIGVDMNLPTGKAQLSNRERIAEAGESNDLFEVDNFGDGFNLGLSLGLVRDIGDMSLGFQGAYIFYSKYDPTSDIPEDKFDPGDQFLGLALLGWQASPRFALDGFVAYAYFTSDQRNGEEMFREGDTLILGGNFRYDHEPVGMTLSVQGTVQGKNEEVIEEKLQTEADNSNGNDFFGLIDVIYGYSSNLTFRLLGNIRYYGESDLKNESDGRSFEGQRIRYAMGPGFIYSLGEHLSCDGLLKFFVMSQDPDMTTDQEVRYQGINLNVGFMYTF